MYKIPIRQGKSQTECAVSVHPEVHTRSTILVQASVQEAVMVAACATADMYTQTHKCKCSARIPGATVYGEPMPGFVSKAIPTVSKQYQEQHPERG